MAEMMRLDVFRQKVLEAAKEAGFEQAEVYTVRADSLRVMATGGRWPITPLPISWAFRCAAFMKVAWATAPRRRWTKKRLRS